MGLLANKVIVITGGSSGIGRAIAEGCMKEGALVAIAGRSEKKLAETLNSLKKIGSQKCLGLVTDVTKDADLKNLFNQVDKDLGPVYGLIPAAGVYGSIGSFLESSIEEWGVGVEINLLGAVKTVYYGCKSMSPSEGGRVILWSGGGQAALENFSDYVAGKGGIWRLTETFAAEFIRKKIFVNAIAPGPVNSGFVDDLLKAGPEKVGLEFYEKALKQKKEGGAGPDKTVDLCLYLLSGQSTGLYGKTISALWDNYREWTDLETLSRSDQFTYKRIVEPDGGTRFRK